MKHTSIATLKARLSEFLDAVKSGEEIVVTDRGRPVARLIPVSGTNRTHARVAELVRTGYARPPRETLRKDFWKLSRPRDPEGKVREALVDERSESR